MGRACDLFLYPRLLTPRQESEAMKPHNRIKGRLAFSDADNVLERIRIITRELENIQTEIHGRMADGLHPDKDGLLCNDASAQVLGRFRDVLDQVRNMLWLCTEAGESAARTRGPQRDRQLAQAAALLRALAPSGPASSAPPPVSSSSPREPGAQSPISFFDRLDRVIDNYVEGGGTLVQPTPRRGHKT